MDKAKKAFLAVVRLSSLMNEIKDEMYEKSKINPERGNSTGII